ncbi:MAG: molybdopterin biosynthesis protein [Ruminococcaceae bacterium]|nr:molybdopterin biosynthesis protein [Oscillospiraceae bacterium]
MAKRNLYLSNTPPDEALGLYMAALEPLLARAAEEIAVPDALDRVTAQAVFARHNSPLYDSAAMDGIAVVSAATAGAGETTPVRLQHERDFVVVDTGDPVMPPYDAVVMAEDLEELADGGVRIRAAAAPWQHVRPVGEDIVQGEMILPSAHRVRPIDIGVLLSGGITRLWAVKQPRVAILPTGTELVEPGAEPREGDIIESNSRMFEALVLQGGGRPTRFAPLPDDYDALKAWVQRAAARYDMVLINAGSSAGTEDYTVHILRELGQVVVHGVAIKPGKPAILAVVGKTPVIGLPGYPVSAFLAYQNFAAPVLARLAHLVQPQAETVRAVITRRLVSSLKYREYVRVKVGRVGQRLVAAPLARGAGAAMSLVRADGFCIIEQDSEGVEAGQTVDVVLNRDIAELANTLVSIGSHDLILDLIADMLPVQFPGMHLSSTHVGSMGGLLALQRGEAHMAPTHLLDEATGTYNIPILRQLFPDTPMALIKGVGRTQGIMVQPGNPLGITGVQDLPGARYINRQRGAGTRVLLDHLLAAAGVVPDSIAGYDREAATHMAVAATVASGSADAGMGVLSAARAMGLDFIPVGDEAYDFALPAAYLELPFVRAFMAVLKSDEFLGRLQTLGGYTSARCGEVILLKDT